MYSSIASCTLPLVLLLAMVTQEPAGGARQRVPRNSAPQATPNEPAGVEVDVVIHDVSDLCAMRVEPGFDADQAYAARAACLAELEQLVRDNVNPPALHGNVAGLGDGKLVVLATAAQQSMVREFLDDLRAFQVLLFDLRFQELTLPAEQAAELGVDEVVLSLVAGPESPIETLLRAAAADSAVEHRTAPRVLARNGIETESSTMEPLAYVARFERYEHVEPAGESLVVPIVEQVEEGVRVRCKVVRGTGGHATVQFSAEFKAVKRPIEVRLDELGRSCIPVVTTRRVSSTVVIPSTGYGVVFPVATLDGRTTLVLMGLELIEPVPEPK